MRRIQQQGARVFSGWLSSLILVLVMASGAFGSQVPSEEPTFMIETYGSQEPTFMIETYGLVDPARFGETTMVPAWIDFAEEWKTAKITFVSKNAPFQLEEITLGEGGYGYDFYIPVTINSEGRYDFKGTITVEAKDGELFYNGQSTWTNRADSFGVFAFEGEVFFAGDSGRAMSKLAHRDLLKSNSEYASLIAKRKGIEQGTLAAKLSEDEDARIKELFDEAVDKVYKKYGAKYPTKKSPTSFFKTLSVKPQKGEKVNLEVNFPINGDYTKFLPLDGAKITVYNSANDKQIATGVLDGGAFSFVSPDNNLSFTAKVTAQHNKDGIKFDIHAADRGIIEIGFQDTNIFNIGEVENNDNELLDIRDYEAKSWSVFQAILELERLSKTVLNFNKDTHTVLVDLDRSSYTSSTGTIKIAKNRYFNWDTIAHEFSHAIADETKSTIAQGGAHIFGINQYDLPCDGDRSNSATCKNKEASLKLAFNEAYATWLGVSLLKNSSYKKTIEGVDDDIYQGGATYSLEQIKDIKAFGEDAELAISNLLWDIVDDDPEPNQRALCKNGCEDAVRIPLREVFDSALKGKKISSVSGFYNEIYKRYASSSPTSVFKSAGNVKPEIVERTHQLGAIFAEFGIAPHINEKDNSIKLQSVYESTPAPLTLKWKQLKTGTMPGLDKFEILFFNAGKDKLLYKIVINELKADIDTYSYTFSNNDISGLKKAFSQSNPVKVHIIVKGIASGKGAEKGAIETGPYYGNLASFDVGNRHAAITVDSSGSNTSTDPSNLRKTAANQMLCGLAGADQSSGNADARLYSVAAYDFDSGVKTLSDFAPPSDLCAAQIFNRIDSSGGTDIAAAINVAVGALNSASGTATVPFPNQKRLYALTDMENGGGMQPVTNSLKNASTYGVQVNIGHLQPLNTGYSLLSSSALEINGDLISVMRARVPFDDVIEAILETGGSYAIIQDARSQEAWAQLMLYLSEHDPDTLTEIPLPFNVQYYGLAKRGKQTPSFLITPPVSGIVTISVDNKNGFTPNIKVDDYGYQEYEGGLYKLSFNAYAGRQYRVTISDNLYDSGLYSIVANIESAPISSLPLPKTSLITTGATISDNGEVLVWGFRGSGQQGAGKLSVASNAKPAKAEGLRNIVGLTGGAYHLIALDQDGALYGWGQSGYGETGCKPDTGIYVTTPCKVLSGIVQVAAGEYFTIALSADGKVYTWGHNLYGQLGNGSSKNSQTPIVIDLNGEKTRLIGAAYEGAFAVTENNRVYAWGDNEASGLGFKGTNYGVQKIVRTPVHITNLDQYASKIVYIAGGNGWGEALLDDGRVIGWGVQASLGQGTTKTSLSSPDPIVILDNVKSLFARYVGSVALTNDGTVYTWGQTGGSAFKHIYGESPTAHIVNGVVSDIGGGKEHIFYKTESGDLYGVGYNDLYKLNLNKLGGIVDWEGERVEVE
jgi:alpha-tubulin suppressor-like RCC1 family protein